MTFDILFLEQSILYHAPARGTNVAVQVATDVSADDASAKPTELFRGVASSLGALFESRDVAHCHHRDTPNYDTVRQSLWSAMARFADVCRSRADVMTSLLFRFLE